MAWPAGRLAQARRGRQRRTGAVSSKPVPPPHDMAPVPVRVRSSLRPTTPRPGSHSPTPPWQGRLCLQGTVFGPAVVHGPATAQGLANGGLAFCRHAMCGSHGSSAHPQVWQSSIRRGASRSYPRGRGDDGRGLAADTLVLELPPRARGRLRLRLLASPVPTRTRRTPLQVTDHRRDRPTVGARGRHPLQQCARAGIRDDAPRLARPTPPALTTRNSGRSASRSRQEPRACRRNRARPRGGVRGRRPADGRWSWPPRTCCAAVAIDSSARPWPTENMAWNPGMTGKSHDRYMPDQVSRRTTT
ncbi:hypothetical protein QO019_001978 [Streptomyces thermodiastaticus]|uniref:Uncharacterized protein n=1 Tax=Streptomyces thermodiastaticus TaxID=44061 RepID=A0ABU0KCL4_9ACTN|nr:hypothetical protein [Streptomyces thermodiastaticus]